METSTCPPRIIPNDSVLSKVAAPGLSVTVSFPAFIMSLRCCQSENFHMNRESAIRINFIFGRIWPLDLLTFRSIIDWFLPYHSKYSVFRLDPYLNILR